MIKRIITILLTLCLCVGCFLGCSKKESALTKEQMEQILKNDLPIGTSEEKVSAYLTAKNIEHSSYDENGKKIQAMVKDVKKSFLVSKSIHIVFSFNGDSKLTGFAIQDIFTGP